MRTRLNVLSALAAAGSLVAMTAQAHHSITVTETSVTPIVGGSQWTYSATFVNSTVNPGDFWTVNDFGPAVLFSTTLPAGWSMTQTPVGPNSLPAVDNPLIDNVTFTWTGAAGTMVSPNDTTATVFNFVLNSPGSASVKLGLYTSVDQVTSGDPNIVGTDSRVIGFVSLPSAPPIVPDGGMTVALLGFALVGVEGLRRKFAK